MTTTNCRNYPLVSDYRERKKLRTEYYLKHVYGWTLADCGACSGSGYYCGKPCGCCDGTGKERVRGPKAGGN